MRHFKLLFALLLFVGVASAQTLDCTQIKKEGTKAQYQYALGECHYHNGEFQQAIDSYDKAIGENPPLSDEQKIKVFINEGNSYLKLHRNKEAVLMYVVAAKTSPNPALAYFNICAVMYNVGDTARAKDFCKTAIKYDPGKADAYFILGSVLLADSPIDNGKLQVTPGTREALEKYIELTPDGPHATDVKAMLEYIK